MFCQGNAAGEEEEDMPALTVGPKNIRRIEYLEGEILPNMRRTKFETLLLILNFSMRHGLSAVAVEDLCSMVNVILGANVIPSTRHMFKTVFSGDMPLKYHMYCPHCVAYMGEITKALRARKVVPCPVCTKQCNVPGLNGKDFFVTLPVKRQIADMLQNMDDVLEQLHHRWERNPSDDIRDVFDGDVYKNLCEEGKFLSHRYNLSLTFNTDGASVFESGCTTMWPIFFRLNELKPENRFDESNCMVAGLWFGNKEPAMEMYFKCFLSECKDLYESGIHWKAPNGQVIHSKVITLNCVLDSVAKPKLQATKQFNGTNSCPYCNHPGERYGTNMMCKWPMGGDNISLLGDMSFIYTLDKMEPVGGRLTRITYTVFDRKDEKMREDMIIAEERRALEPDFTGYKGLKGKSAMCLLPFFDVSFGFQIDYLHSVLMGCTKHLASFWFDSFYSEEEFSIRDSLAEIDNRLLALTPPTSISRRPRTLKQRADWHGNEWRSWLLYYSLPCLKGFLPNRYLKHHCMLVSAIHTLLKDNISRHDLESATWNLGEYVSDFQNLYTPEEMFFNVHLLLHLGKSVKFWGQLNCFSMFSFESSNNSLIKLVKGTTGVASQIVSKYSVCKFLPHLLKVYDVSDEVLKFCSDLMCYKRFSNASKVGDTTLIGNQKFIPLQADERHIFEANGVNATGGFYERLIRNRILYHGRLYSRRGEKSDDSVVRLKDGSYAAIWRIVKRMDGQIVLFLRKINVERDFVAGGCRAKHIKLCSPVVYGDFFFSNVQDIVTKSIIMPCRYATYIADFPNTIEKD